MIWAGGRGGGTSHPGLALGKFLTHRLAGENRRFFKQPGKSECVSDLCDFLTRTSFVQSKSLTTPPIRTTKDASSMGTLSAKMCVCYINVNMALPQAGAANPDPTRRL